jgi:hypothetical protein
LNYSSFLTKILRKEKKDILLALNSWEVIESSSKNNRINAVIKWMTELTLFRVIFLSWSILWLFEVSLLDALSSFQKFIILALLAFAMFRREYISLRAAERLLDSRKNAKINI